MTTALAGLVAAAPGTLVVPVRPRGASVDVPTPLCLLDALELGAGRWVGVVEDGDGERWTVPLVVDAAGVRRALAGDGVAAALVHALRDDGRTGSFAIDAWHSEDVAGERAVTVDQTNDSIVVGERAVVKWCVRLPRAGVAGAQPATARLATLGAQGFSGTPRPWGLLRFTGGGESLLLASIAEFLPGALDGWDWAVDDVRRFARGETTSRDALSPATRLGRLTAQLHVALASGGRDAADDRLVARWTARAYDDLDAVVQLVDGPEGTRLRARSGRIAASFGAFRDCVGTPLIDVHGDLHVGQVLRHGDPVAYAVTDFDGSPVLAPEERSARQPAALDVAGMLASLDHVGRVVVRRTDGVDPDVVRGWISAAQAAFLDEYRDTLGRNGSGDLLDERLLAPLRLQQECREFLYAVHHLPHWRYVPDAALVDLLPDEE